MAADNHQLVEAQYLAGKMYEEGKGVEQDYKEALKYYRLAADRDFADAMYSIAACYLYGKDVVPNLTNAMEWHCKQPTRIIIPLIMN